MVGTPFCKLQLGNHALDILDLGLDGFPLLYIATDQHCRYFWLQVLKDISSLDEGFESFLAFEEVSITHGRPLAAQEQSKAGDYTCQKMGLCGDCPEQGIFTPTCQDCIELGAHFLNRHHVAF